MDKPNNFKDLLELKKELDNKIHSTRERTYIDIELSMIAEIIEFNEETKLSHKTWKTKQVDEEKMKEELIDVLFFFLQYCNNQKIIHIDIYEEMLNETIGKSKEKLSNMDICDLIFALISGDIIGTFENLVNIFNKVGMTRQDVLDGYYNKWLKNMKRIGSEWN